MIGSCLMGLVCGASLALRFRVMALLPSQGLAIAFAAILIVLDQISVSDAMRDFAGWSLGLQAGYAALSGIAALARSENRS